MINPRDVHLLSSTPCSAAAVRAAVGFDEIAARHPHHEIFVLWNRQDPANHFAIVFRFPKAVVARDGWPPYLDSETRMLQMNPFVDDRPPPDDELIAAHRAAQAAQKRN